MDSETLLLEVGPAVIIVVVQASFADRNVFAYMLAIGVPFAFYVFLTERLAWIRWPMLGCLPLLMNAVMLTFGRAAFIAMGAGAIWSVLRLRRVALTLGCGVLGALLMYRLAGTDVVARVLTIEQYEQDESATGRRRGAAGLYSHMERGNEGKGGGGEG